MTTNANPYALIEADDSILVVIDVQDAFLGKLPRQDSKRLLNNVCWLIKLALWRGIPLVVTAEASYHTLYDGCYVEFLSRMGVKNEWMRLGEIGIRGNGHMMMLELNNMESAQAIEGWLVRNVGR